MPWGHPDHYEQLFRLAEGRADERARSEAAAAQNRQSWSVLGVACMFLVSITIIAGWWVLHFT